MNTWDLSPDTLRFLEDRGMLSKLSNKPIRYGGSMDYVKAFDGSNYTSGTGQDGEVTPEDAQRVHDAGYALAILQALIPPPGFPHAGDATFSARLASVFSDAGCDIDAYLYWLPGALPFEQKINTMSGVSVRQWWVDLEEKPGIAGEALTASVRDALAKADTAPSTLGEQSGVYTSDSWLEWYTTRGGDMAVFDGRKLWLALWDGNADPTVAGRVPTNMRVCVKQYAGTNSIAGVSGVDLDVLTEEEGNTLNMNVQQVPDDYRQKFALSGPYDWPGVAANLEGIIHELENELQNAEQSASQSQSPDDVLTSLRAILARHGYTSYAPGTDPTVQPTP